MVGTSPMLGSPEAWADARACTLELPMLQHDDSPREKIVRINKCKVTFIVNIIL